MLIVDSQLLFVKTRVAVKTTSDSMWVFLMRDRNICDAAGHCRLGLPECAEFIAFWVDPSIALPG